MKFAIKADEGLASDTLPERRARGATGASALSGPKRGLAQPFGVGRQLRIGGPNPRFEVAPWERPVLVVEDRPEPGTRSSQINHSLGEHTEPIGYGQL